MGHLPRRHGRPWRSPELAALTEGQARGLSIDQLAVRHGRTRRAIGIALERLELSRSLIPGDLVINGRNYRRILRNASRLIHATVDLHASLPGVGS